MSLEAYIINVGKGNTVIIDPPSGRLTMVDIDDSRAVSDQEKSAYFLKSGIELTNPFDYIDKNFPNRPIFRFILTHPDMDHMSGIKELFTKRNVANFWDIEPEKDDPEDWSRPYDEDDWKFYKKLRSGEIPGITLIKNSRGVTGDYWTPDNIEILHPHSELEEKAEDAGDFDHLSHVVKVGHAGRKFLLCGDATVEAIDSIYSDSNTEVDSDVVLAPGHGSKNHVHKDFMKDIGHKLTVASVAQGVDYDYDFYSNFGPVLSTKHHGNIKLSISDGGTVYFTTQTNDYSDSWYKLNL